MAVIGTYNDLLASSISCSRLIDYIHDYEPGRFSNANNLYEEGDFSKVRHEETTINLMYSQNEHKRSLSSTNVETKQKGILKWRVYMNYLQAGVGIVFGLFILVFLSIVQQGVYLFGSWWLAVWNDAESYRYQNLTDCTTLLQNNSVRFMTDAEWNHYRARQFYVYTSLCS